MFDRIYVRLNRSTIVHISNETALHTIELFCFSKSSSETKKLLKINHTRSGQNCTAYCRMWPTWPRWWSLRPTKRFILQNKSWTGQHFSEINASPSSGSVGMWNMLRTRTIKINQADKLQKLRTFEKSLGYQSWATISKPLTNPDFANSSKIFKS